MTGPDAKGRDRIDFKLRPRARPTASVAPRYRAAHGVAKPFATPAPRHGVRPPSARRGPMQGAQQARPEGALTLRRPPDGLRRRSITAEPFRWEGDIPARPACH